MLREVITSIRVQGPTGPAELRLERTRVLKVAGRPNHENTEAVPLDMVDAVSYGEEPRNALWSALGLLALVALAAGGYLRFPDAPLVLYGAAGLGVLLLLAGALATLRSGGRRLRLRSDGADWLLTYPKQQAPEVAAFLERLMMVRLAFLEGVYGEEDAPAAPAPPAPKRSSAPPTPYPDEEE